MRLEFHIADNSYMMTLFPIAKFEFQFISLHFPKNDIKSTCYCHNNLLT